jgi:hypothetical protein
MISKRSEVEITFDQLLAKLDAKRDGAKNQLLVQAIEALKPVVDLLDVDLEQIKPPPFDVPLKGRPPNTKRSAIKSEIIEEANKKKLKVMEKR